MHNWRQLSTDQKYPRYPSVRKTLEVEWQRFCDFLTQERLGLPQVTQCEVTYVNHLDYDRGWGGYGELSRVIAAWSGSNSGAFLPAPERVRVETHYRLPDKAGRLHVAVDPVIRARDSTEVLQITLTARGAPRSSSTEGILDWIDLGHIWVVRGFTDFTTQAMHNIWGRKS
jgi:uncharacterized protein (TIGR04255 family)